MSRGLVLVVAVVISLAQAEMKKDAQVRTVSVRNTKKYPICISDSDCDNVSKKAKLDHP